MAYPKPLSEKSLERLYSQSGLSQRQIDFLHSFFRASANLYGAIQLRDAWQVYTQAAGKAEYPSIHRKDMIAFSGIVRREDLPYCVFEIDELYEAEKRADLSREIVSKELIGKGYGKLRFYYELMEEIGQEPYYVPDDILAFADGVPGKAEAELAAFIGKLKVTAKECHPRYGDPYPCEHRGKTLDSFSFLNKSERFDEEYYRKKPAAVDQLREDTAGTEAEKIMRLYRRMENIGRLRATDNLQYVLEELEEVGVELKDSQVNQLVSLMNDCHNNSHLWCVSGWCPSDLSKYYYGNNSGPTAISFGPGMQKAFRDGSLDKEELVKAIKKMGLDVLDK